MVVAAAAEQIHDAGDDDDVAGWSILVSRVRRSDNPVDYDESESGKHVESWSGNPGPKVSLLPVDQERSF